MFKFQKSFLIIIILSVVVLNFSLHSFAEDNITQPIQLENANAVSESVSKLTLKQALDEAMQNNRHVQSAIATLPVAQASLIISKYMPNPYIFSYHENAHGGAFHPADAGKEFEIGRKRYWRIRLAKEQIKCFCKHETFGYTNRQNFFNLGNYSTLT